MRTFIGIWVVALAGCGVSESSVGVVEDDPIAEDAELSAYSRTFVALRRDFRRCIAPLCGGYWVHDVNRAVFTETYVSGLDFSASGLSDTEQALVHEGLDVVLLRGKLGPIETTWKTRPFIVSEAYRGMPGLPLGQTDRFYKVKAVDIQCFRAPCATLSATRVNRTTATLFHSLDLTGLGNGLELKWLSKRATEDGAITSGVLVQNGESISLEALNVFVKLPERQGPCPLFRLTLCPTGQVRTYTRTADRCMIPSTCVTQGACTKQLLACAEGYTLASWPTRPDACLGMVCDPTWLSGAR